jgi:hypothetical protein
MLSVSVVAISVPSPRYAGGAAPAPALYHNAGDGQPPQSHVGDAAVGVAEPGPDLDAPGGMRRKVGFVQVDAKAGLGRQFDAAVARLQPEHRRPLRGCGTPWRYEIDLALSEQLYRDVRLSNVGGTKSNDTAAALLLFCEHHCRGDVNSVKCSNEKPLTNADVSAQ